MIEGKKKLAAKTQFLDCKLLIMKYLKEVSLTKSRFENNKVLQE